jgi:hypothetical protein
MQIIVSTKNISLDESLENFVREKTAVWIS